MAKKQFKAESKKLLEMMINSIYTNKEIFLRELISNASDALDKRHYLSIREPEKYPVSSQDLKITITRNKDTRQLIIEDRYDRRRNGKKPWYYCKIRICRI